MECGEWIVRRIAHASSLQRTSLFSADRPDFQGHQFSELPKDPLAAGGVKSLDQRSAEIWQRTFELAQRESREYRNSLDQEFTQESQSHCGALLYAIIAVAAGRVERSKGDPFGFVRTHAEWRARHQVPLDRLAACLPARSQAVLADHAGIVVAARRPGGSA